jgi:4-hydroxybenzoate polyprenyltransferase
MNNPSVERDERAQAVENASYRLAATILLFGLLGLAVIRSYFFNQNTWDLLGLAILGSLSATAYQAYHRVITRRWLWWGLIISLISAVLAAIIAWYLS